MVEELNCQAGSRYLVVWGSNLGFVMLRNAIYSGPHRNATTAAHVRDHEVEMESDKERRLTRRRVQQHTLLFRHHCHSPTLIPWP